MEQPSAPPPKELTEPPFPRNGKSLKTLLYIARTLKKSAVPYGDQNGNLFQEVLKNDTSLEPWLLRKRDEAYQEWDAYCQRKQESILSSGGRHSTRGAPKQGSVQQQQQEADDRAEAEMKAAAAAERKAYFDEGQKAYFEDTAGAVERHEKRLLKLAKQPWSYALMAAGMCVCNSSVCFSLAFSLCAWLAANRWLPAEPAKKARKAQSKGAPILRVLTLKDAFTTFPKLDPQLSLEAQISAVTDGTCEAVTLLLPDIAAFDAAAARRTIGRQLRRNSDLRKAVRNLRRKTDPSAAYPSDLDADQCLNILVAEEEKEYRSPIERVSEECTATVDALRESKMPLRDFLDAVKATLVVAKGSMALTTESVAWTDGARVDTRLDAYLDAVAQGLVSDKEAFWSERYSSQIYKNDSALGAIFTDVLRRRGVPVEDAGAYARFSLLGGGEGNGAAASLLSMEEPMRVVVEYGAVQELDSLGMQVAGRIIISFTRRGQKFYALAHRDLLVLANEVTLACLCWMISVLGPCLFAKPQQRLAPFGPVKKLERDDKGIVVGKDSDTKMMSALRTVFPPMAAQIDEVLAALIKTLVALGVEL